MKNKLMILAAAALLFSCQKKEEKTVIEETTIEAEAPAATTPAEEQTCYLSVISKDSIVLNITKKGDSISGTFKWLPAEKDKKISQFKGVLNGNTVTAIGSASAEGTTNKEELIFTLDGGQAKVKFGEMAQGKNGIWVYKDKAATSEQVLNKVDCL
jgi:uncharacterized lipoprotein YajG